MGRTKGKSRSSTASSARSVPYDLDLPENKTVAQLKYKLSNRGIEFPKNAKKSQLIKLLKNYAGPEFRQKIGESRWILVSRLCQNLDSQ